VSNANGETNSKNATINVLQVTSSSDGRSSGGSLGRANVVSSGSTLNTSAAANVTQQETNTLNIEQNSKLANVEQTTKQTTEQTPSPNTSGKGSTKAPGFETFFGIVSLLAVLLHKRNKEGN
jgi:hypothetical protein